MTLPRPFAPLALLAFALSAAPAHAAGPVPLLASQRAQDVAVAGNEVVVASAGADGSVRVDALPVQGGPARRLLSAPPPGRGWEPFMAVSASPQRVALAVLYLGETDDVRLRLYSGPEAGPLGLVERGGPRSPSAPLAADVDGDRMVVLEAGRRTARLRLLVPGAAPRVVPWPGDIGSEIALAGDRVAFRGSARHRKEPVPNHLFIVDAATGAALASTGVGLTAEFDLAADGRAVADDTDSSVFTLAPGMPRRPLPGTDSMRLPRFAGPAVAGVEDTPKGTAQPVVLDPGSRTPRPVGVPSVSIDELDADEHGVAWIANHCVVYAPLDATAPEALPPGPCPRAEAEVEGASMTLRGRRLRLVATCIAAPAGGCTGTAKVHLFDHGIVGRGRFHAEPGKQAHFTARLSRRGVRVVRREVRRDDGVLLRIFTRVSGGGRPNGDGFAFVDRVRRAAS